MRLRKVTRRRSLRGCRGERDLPMGFGPRLTGPHDVAKDDPAVTPDEKCPALGKATTLVEHPVAACDLTVRPEVGENREEETLRR